jgi:hypothetical protein
LKVAWAAKVGLVVSEGPAVSAVPEQPEGMVVRVAHLVLSVGVGAVMAARAARAALAERAVLAELVGQALQAVPR